MGIVIVVDCGRIVGVCFESTIGRFCRTHKCAVLGGDRAVFGVRFVTYFPEGYMEEDDYEEGQSCDQTESV